jgi:hypothetical protein
VTAPCATFSAGKQPDGFFNFLSYDTTGSSSAAQVGDKKKRTSSGLGSMLLSRRSSKADVDDSAHLI